MILYVDDQPIYVMDFIEELRASGYQVVVKTSVDEAWASFEGKGGNIQLLVLDLMMPPGDLFKAAQTGGGLWTGVRFYEMVRAKAPGLPIIVLTNLSDEQIEEKFRSDRKCRFVRKADVNPFEFVEVVGELLP